MKSQASRAAFGRPEFIEVENNVRLHVTDLGDGIPVVLIHGWPFSDAMYEYQYGHLVKSGCRVIGITMRGFGLSDKPYGEYNYDVFADDILAVLKQLQLHDIVLGGFSFGAAAVIRFAAKYNTHGLKKLALFGSAAPSAAQREDFPYGLPVATLDSLIQLNAVNRPQLIEVFSQLFGASESALPNEISRWLANLMMQASGYTTEQGLLMIRDSDLRSDLKRIKIPTVIFHGRLDKLCPFELAEQIHSSIENSRLFAFEKSGHALFLEEREKFNDDLVKFIKSETTMLREPAVSKEPA